jgi:hypothetical protein
VPALERVHRAVELPAVLRHTDHVAFAARRQIRRCARFGTLPTGDNLRYRVSDERTRVQNGSYVRAPIWRLRTPTNRGSYCPA